MAQQTHEFQGEGTLVMHREGCTCFLTMGRDGMGYSLCADHEAERDRLNAAAPSGFHFGAGLSGGWIIKTSDMGG
jgi:hypothetical protein